MHFLRARLFNLSWISHTAYQAFSINYFDLSIIFRYLIVLASPFEYTLTPLLSECLSFPLYLSISIGVVVLLWCLLINFGWMLMGSFSFQALICVFHSKIASYYLRKYCRAQVHWFLTLPLPPALISVSCNLASPRTTSVPIYMCSIALKLFRALLMNLIGIALRDVAEWNNVSVTAIAMKHDLQ